MTDWSNDLILEYLELYRYEPVLWDPSHTHHKDKKKVNDAWIRLSERIQRPVADLKRKKESFMATFRGHLRKKKASIKAGAVADDIYKPVWFAYELMESFLAPVYKVDASLLEQDMIDGKNEDDIEGVETGDKPIVPSTSIATATRPKNRRRDNRSELQEVGKEESHILHNILTKRTRDDEEDECDLYAKMLARKLRRLPEHEREIFMYEIDGMFINRIHPNYHLPTATISYSNATTMDQAKPSSNSETPMSNASSPKRSRPSSASSCSNT